MSNQVKKQIINLHGVTYLGGRWSAQYEKNGKVIHLGFFRYGIQAYRAYVRAIIESGQDVPKDKECIEILFKKSYQNPPQS